MSIASRVRKNFAKSRLRRLLLERLEQRSLLAVLTVTNTDDSGLGSFRHALETANNTAELDEVRFAIPGNGIRIIQPQTALPNLTAPIHINGFSQPGSERGTSDPADSKLLIQVRGDAISDGSGLSIAASSSGSIIEGLSLNGWSKQAIEVLGSNSNIQGNWIHGNGDGIVISGSNAVGNQIRSNLVGPSPSSTVGSQPQAAGFFRADNSTVDAISNAQLELLPPATAPDFAVGKVGRAFSFNGSDDAVTVGNPPSLRMTNQFSFQTWVLPTAAPFWSGIIFSKDGEYQLTRWQDGRLAYWIAGLPDWIFTDATAPLHSWTHAALVFDAGTMRLYVNGDLVHTNSSLPMSFGDTYPQFNEFQLGNRDQDNPAFSGLIDEAAVYNRPLTLSEVQFAYNEGNQGRDGVTGTNPVSLWRGEDNFLDSAGSNHGLNRAPIFAPGKVGTSFEFDGETTYLSAGNLDVFRFSSVMSFEAWVYPTNVGSGTQPGYEGGILVNKEGEYEIRRTPTGKLSYAFANSAPGWAWVDTDVDLPANQWTHMALTYNAGTVRVYANGALVHTGLHAGSIGDVDVRQNDLRLGGRQGGDQHFHGRMDQVAIYDRVLNAAEVQSSYSLGNAGADGVTANAPLAAWLGNNSYGDLRGRYPLAEKGAGYASGISGTAFEFDGVDDQLSISNAPQYKFSNQLSIEAWIYPTGPGYFPNSFAPPVIINREGEYQIVRQSNGEIWYSVANSDPGWYWVFTGYRAPENTWTHLVLSYNGSMLSFYANGELVHSVAGTGPIGDVTPTLNDTRLGGRQFHVSHFQGRIDGVALYGRALTALEAAANYRGRGATFLTQPPNARSGVRIQQGAKNNTIGGSIPSDRNVISSNGEAGVLIAGDGTNLNNVLNNWIGIDPSGTKPAGNSSDGVRIEEGAKGNSIGSATAGNVIAANQRDGVRLTGTGTTGNTVAGNVMGLNKDGERQLEEHLKLWLEGSPTLDDVVSGNRGQKTGRVDTGYAPGFPDSAYGLFSPSGSVELPSPTSLQGMQSLSLQVEWAGDGINGGGLFVRKGLDNDGLGSYGFHRPAGGDSLLFYVRINGVIVYAPAYTLNAYTVSIPIHFTGTFDGNVVRLFANGSEVGSGTLASGVVSYGLSGSENFFFGSTTTSSQAFDNIRVWGKALSQVEINASRTTLIKSPLINRGSGIYAVGTGANMIGGVGAAGNLVAGHANGIAIANSTGVILQGNILGTDKANSVALSNTNGITVSGSSQIRIGAAVAGSGNVVAASDGSGIAISSSTEVTLEGNLVGLTSNGSRDFARGFHGVYVDGNSQVVVGTAAAGNVISGSHVYQINARSNLAGGIQIQNNLIGTNVIGNEQGYVTTVFQPAAMLLEKNVVLGTNGDGVDDDREGNTIVGTTLMHNASNINVAGNRFGTDRLGQKLIGQGSTIDILRSSAIRIGTNSDGVGDRHERNIINAGRNSIGVWSRESSQVTVAGNYIGTNATGTSGLGNLYGVLVVDGGNVTIGGTSPAAANIVSGNATSGIRVYVGNNTMSVRGNLIGLDATGRTALGNGGSGIELDNAPISIENNTISGNGYAGISGYAIASMTIQGNRIGTDVSGTLPTGNAVGIALDASNATIGGTTAASANIIAFNRGPGIALPTSQSVSTIGRNQFFGNTGLAIDVGAAGTQLNDSGDVDGLLNFPVITSADIDDATSELVVSGVVGAGRTVQFFRSSANNSNFGEGQAFLFSATEGSAADLLAGTESYGPIVGGVTVGSDTASRFRFRIPLTNSLGITIGDRITAIANGSTSEFGPSVMVGTYQGNVAPAVTASAVPNSAAAGTSIQFTGSVIDDDSVRWTALADMGDGTPLRPVAVANDQTFEMSYTYANPGSYSVKFFVTDNGGTTGTATLTVAVLNSTPELPSESLRVTSSLVEGDTATVTGSYSDNDLQPGHSILVNFGDGSPAVPAVVDANARLFRASHRYLDDGISRTPVDVYSILVSIADPSGAVTSNPIGALVTEVRNDRPVFQSLTPSQFTLQESEAVTLNGSFLDAGVLDVHTITIDWNDGTIPEQVVLTPGTRSFTGITHRFPDRLDFQSRTYQVAVTLTDDDDLIGTTRILPITVVPAPPSAPAIVLSSASIFEGQSIQLTGTFVDYGANELHDVTIAWGDGTITTLRLAPGQFTIPATFHTYVDDPVGANDQLSIVVTVTDEGGLSATSSTTLTVANANPTLSNLQITAPANLREGDTVSLTGSFADNGRLDSHAIVVSWGDGTTSPATIDAVLRTFTATHVMRDDLPTNSPLDTISFDVAITDDDGGTTTATAGTLQIANEAPTVTLGNNPLAPSTATTIQLKANIADVGADTFSIRWQVYEDTAATPVLDVINTSLTLSYPRNVAVFKHRFVVTVTDDDTGFSTDAMIVETLDDNNNILIQPTQPVLPAGVTRYAILSLGGADVVDVSNWTIPVLLDGGAGLDVLTGGQGDDLIILHQGDDEGYGGPGTDAYQMTFNSTLTVSDFSGQNQLDFSPTPFGVTFDFAATSETTAVTQDVGLNSAQPAMHFAKINGNFSSLTATRFADKLTGRDNASVFGDAGNDEFFARPNATGVGFFGGADADTFSNGAALGSILFDGGADADTFSNFGGGLISTIQFEGDDGIDVLSNLGSLGTVIFDGGADADTFSNSGQINSILFDGGADADTFSNSGVVLTTITFDGGADSDTLSNLNQIHTIIFDGGADADTFLNSGTVLNSITFDGGADADTLSNLGQINTIVFDGGADADTLLNSGLLTSIVFDGGADADFLTNSGTVIGQILFDGGANSDRLTNSGSLSALTFLGGADGDTLTNNASGTIASLVFNGDAGVDWLVQRGTVQTISFTGGADADLLSNIGSATSIIFDGGADADTFINSGILTSIVFDGGADSDVLTNLGNMAGNVQFDGGSGFDRFQNEGTIRVVIPSSSLGSQSGHCQNGLVRFRGGSETDTFVNRGELSIRLTIPNNATANQYSQVGLLEFDGGSDADFFLNTSTISINFEGDDALDSFVDSGMVRFVGLQGNDAFINEGSISRTFQGTGFSSAFLSQPGVQFLGGADADLFLNTSTLLESIEFSGDDGADQLVNRGTLRSITFNAGADNDSFYNFGSVSQALSFSGDSSLAQAGNDLLFNSGTVPSLEFFGLAGNDTLVNQASGLSSIRFDGNAGNDVLVNSGAAIASILFNGGTDDDQLINEGIGLASLSFVGGDGQDLLINRADSFGTIVFYGADEISQGLAERDVMVNSGNSGQSILFMGGGGNDLAQQLGGDISLVELNLESGEDLVINRGDRIQQLRVQGGTENDRFENHGDHIGGITFEAGLGDDVLFNAGWYNGPMSLIGSDGADSFFNVGAFATEIVMDAGAGDDQLINSGAQTQRTRLYGGAGKDRLLLAGSDSRDVVFEGGDDNDLFILQTTATDASGVTFNAGNGNDVWSPSGARLSNAAYLAGDGDDQFLLRGPNASSLNLNLGNGNDAVYIAGDDILDILAVGGAGADNFLLEGQRIDRAVIQGGNDDDSLTIEGRGSGSIEFQGEDGADFFYNAGDGYQQLSFNGGAGNDRMQNHGSELGTLRFDAGLGNNTWLQSGSGILQVHVAGDGNQTLLNYGSLIGLFRIVTGSGNDSLVSTGSQIQNSAIQMGNGTNSALFRGDDLSSFQFTGGSGADSYVVQTSSSPALEIVADGSDGPDTFVITGTVNSVSLVGGSGNDRFTIGTQAQQATFDGGTENDVFEFMNDVSGAAQIVEAFSGTSDTSQDTLDFSAYTRGPISLDLASTNLQPQTAAPQFSLRLSDAAGIENVVGTSDADTILGNERSNKLTGAKLARSVQSTPIPRTRVQYVLLDFDTYSSQSDGEHLYTEAERVAIRDRIALAYRGNANSPMFDLQVVRSVSELPPAIRDSGSYVTIYFNRTPDFQRAGGLASEIDFGNRNPGGAASVQINGLLGGTQLPPQRNEELLNSAQEESARQAIGLKPFSTSQNFVLLSAKVAIHELGHLLGLRHSDAFGPIGFGMHSPPGAGSFKPEFPGPIAAFETFDHLIGSPASIGTNRFNDLRPLEFGEREAVKLAIAFADPSLTNMNESAQPKNALQAAQLVELVPLSVPTTVLYGMSRANEYVVSTRSVSGAIGIIDGKSESDYYKFSGKQGDIVTVELMSTIIASARQWGQDTIDSILRIYSSNGQLVPYHNSVAVNDDQFEPTDSLLLDITLPSDGDYFIEVDTFARAPSDPNYAASVALRAQLEARNDLTPNEQLLLHRLREMLDDKDTGRYELLIYSFAQFNRTDGVDVLRGRGGVDTIEGGRDDGYEISVQLGTLPTIMQNTSFTHTVQFVDRGGASQRAFVDYGDGTGEVEVPVDLVNQRFIIGRTYPQPGPVTVQLRVTNDDGRVAVQTVTLTVQAIPRPRISAIRVGDGTAQRSVVNQLSVQFDGLVDFSSDAFRVKNRATQLSMNTVATSVDTNGRTTIMLRFIGSGTRAGTNGLMDGNYELEVFGGLVTTRGTNFQFDGDGDGAGGGTYRFGQQAVDRFFAFFGDWDGDRDVDALDSVAFQAALNTKNGQAAYRVAFDVDGDGDVDAMDFAAFRRNLNKTLKFEL